MWPSRPGEDRHATVVSATTTTAVLVTMSAAVTGGSAEVEGVEGMDIARLRFQRWVEKRSKMERLQPPSRGLRMMLAHVSSSHGCEGLQWWQPKGMCVTVGHR